MDCVNVCLLCCSENVIKVYSTESGECIRILEGHTDTVTGVVVNPNNKLQIISCSIDQTIIIWDYLDGVILRVYHLKFPLYQIDIFHHQEQTTLILKKKSSLSAFDVVQCNLPSRKDDSLEIKCLLEDVSNKPNSMAVGCQNKVVAAITDNCLKVKNQKKTVFHKMHETILKCVACHPTELCIATGCSNGVIYYWYNIFTRDKVVKTRYHWHALPVLDLCFTPEGSYLLSGGHECVLVKWQYNSHQKDFLPRLGAPINHVTCSHDNLYYATCHTDNVIQLISNKFELKQVYQGLTCGHHKSKIKNYVPAGLHYDPRSKALVTNGKIGHLQFYSITSDKHLYNLDIVSQNYISPENIKRPLTVTEITAADFSTNGDWLATVELWNNRVMSPELKLKFWKFEDKSQRFTLNTTVEMPHYNEITCVKIRPDIVENGDQQPMAVTTCKDGVFKTWMLVDDTNIYRKNSKWTCTFSGYYRGQSAEIAAYSEDGSLLCVVFGSSLTIWEPDTNVLLQALANQKEDSPIRKIAFGKYGCSHLLVVCSFEKLTVWNLSTCTVVWTVAVNAVCLVPDFKTDIMAVISIDSKAYFFRPSSPDILYKHDMISSSGVVSAVFIPQPSTIKERQLPTASKLYYINLKQQLLCLSEIDVTETSSKKDIYIKEIKPQTALSMILSKENSKQPDIELKPTVKDTKAWKEFLDTPPQVQPAVTSLCQQFIQSMLVKSGEQSVNTKEEDVDSSDEESVMEVESVKDSDDNDDSSPKKRKSKQLKISELKTKSDSKNKQPDRQEKENSASHHPDDFPVDLNAMDWYKI